MVCVFRGMSSQMMHARCTATRLHRPSSSLQPSRRGPARAELADTHIQFLQANVIACMRDCMERADVTDDMLRLNLRQVSAQALATRSADICAHPYLNCSRKLRIEPLRRFS